MQSIRQIATSRPDLYAFEVQGKIRKADIERMAAILAAAFDQQDEVDVLITMPGYDGIEVGAVFDKEGLAVQAKSASHIRKYAVVGAPAWAAAMINAFKPLSPVEAKTFDIEDEAIAWSWISGSRIGEGSSESVVLA